MILKTKEKTKFKKIITDAKTIVIVSHRTPDGDAIGSMLGLGLALKKNANDKKIFLYSKNVPANLSYLPGFEKIGTQMPEQFDLLVALDYADPSRIDMPFSLQEIGSAKIITIDHHPWLNNTGDICIIKREYSSTSSLIFDILQEIKYKLDDDIATCLTEGIFADSVGFRVLPPEEGRILKGLFSYNIPLRTIAEHYNKIPLTNLPTLVKFLSRTTYDENLNLIYSWLDLQDIEVQNNNFSEPPILADFITQIGNADYYISMFELQPNYYKVSFRGKVHTKGDISLVAQKFGGGGHKKAAACKIQGRREEILKKLKDELKKLKK